MNKAIALVGFLSGFLIGAVLGFNCWPPETKVIEVIQPVEVVKPPPKKDTLEPLINAIIHVESHGNDSAVNVSSQAVGCMQIRPIMVREANRILKIKGINEEYKLKDRYSREKSIEIFHIWRDYHHKGHSWERIARCWNGGGKGHEMTATINYWKKVKSNI